MQVGARAELSASDRLRAPPPAQLNARAALRPLHPCNVAQLELADLGLACEFLPVPIEVAEDEWKGVARKYWHNRETYYLPVAVLRAADR